MKLASEFSVPAAPEKVFPLFFDPDTMRGCIPGCAELSKVDETTYRGKLVNEVAHVRFSAGFSAAVSSVTDEPAGKEVTAVLKGEDRRLGSSIKIDARLSVRPDGATGDSSVIGYEMDMALWGKLGRLGEPIIRRRSREVELEFARALATACGAPVEDVPSPRAARRQPTSRRPVHTPTEVSAAGSAPVAPDLAPSVATTRKLAVVATAVSVVALLVAVLRRGR